MLITLFLLLSCGSGQQPQVGKDGEAATGGRSLSAVLMEVGKSAENAFYSFLELLSDTLGLRVTKDTTKNDVGNYYKKLAEGIEKAVGELSAISGQTDQSDKQSEKEANESELDKAIEKAKQMFEKLKRYIVSLERIGDISKVGEVGSDTQKGVSASADELKIVFEALKGIVNSAVEAGVEELKGSRLTLSQASIGVASPENGAKVLAENANAGSTVGDKAAAIVSAVSGEEILASIINSTEDKAVKIGADATADTTPLEFAVGGTVGNIAKGAALASAVSGGIALRSLVKGGKLAANNDANDKITVQAVGITSVNKLLVAVEDIVKKTVKNVLKTAKEKIDEARAPKTAGQ
ncbi:variable large family protein (plasmid) [Borrelia parkeri]|nr:variable large family protein [Borrelia parkeri]UPA11556.1 variable large family protein [Borrelia parkeri]UPA11697.1 variable large family protein [Borrelia parkeri]